MTLCADAADPIIRCWIPSTLNHCPVLCELWLWVGYVCHYNKYTIICNTWNSIITIIDSIIINGDERQIEEQIKSAIFCIFFIKKF